MASERRWTEREADKVRQVVRSSEAPPPPATAHHIRSRGIRRVGHHHNLETTLGVTTVDIANASSGIVRLSQGPHPLEQSDDTITAYNYCGGTIKASTLVKVTWIVMDDTGGFWFAEPCAGTPSQSTIECASCAGGLPSPMSITIGGITDGNDSGSAAALNTTHSLTTPGLCEITELVHANDYLLGVSVGGSTGAYEWRFYIEKQSGTSFQTAWDTDTALAEVSGLANCVENYPNSSGWTWDSGTSTRTPSDGPNMTNITIDLNS